MVKTYRTGKAAIVALIAVSTYVLATSGNWQNVFSPLPSQAQSAATTPDEVSRGRSLKGKASKEPLPDIKPGTLDMEILRDVEKRKEALDIREAELEKREQRLNSLQADIEKQLSELKTVQAKIDESMELRNDLEETAIAKLAKTYASMPPESAAQLIQNIDKAIAIRILSVMKERAAGKILAAAPPDLATRLSEGLVKKR